MPSFNRIPRMFRLPSHRVFDYKPRFYDPEREKFEILKKDQQTKVTMNLILEMHFLVKDRQ